MHNFKELRVWQESIRLSEEIYAITNNLPKEEMYGLNSQIRRAVISIPSNVAEGSGRESKKEFNQFLNISLGSSFELETQLILSENLNFLTRDELSHIYQSLSEIQRMLYGLKKSLRKN